MEQLHVLDDATADRIRDLARRATDHDGVAPLDDAARLALAGDDAVHLLDADGDDLAGYVSVLADGTVQGAVDPARRRRGHGTALLDAALSQRPDAGVWAHGALPGSSAFLRARGLEAVRHLLRMRLDGDELAAAASDRTDDRDVTIRAFTDADADAWVDLNARAFADHPEQGTLTRADLDARRAEDWFDATGFLLAEIDGHLVGFNWTKVEDGIGEIYALGVDAAYRGRGLAGRLTAAGLAHLRAAGVEAVDLYVEADNAPALAVYRRLGFGVAAEDVQFRRRVAPGGH